MDAMKSALKGMSLDANSAQRVRSRLSKELDGMLARGRTLLSLGRIDTATVNQLPCTVRQVQQGQSRQVGQPRTGRGR
ncbi:hypothetical protein [Azohydromonas lata]|uniref:hypothetical protein n=1 Tax=Azohydromonas lata TaxID=45677 RepID=UPI0012F510D5|nr:hypothetical protein [Azohydromonas lata]